MGEFVDLTVEAALRAMVRGMHAGGVMDAAQLGLLVSALEDAAEDQRVRRRIVDEGEILRLSRGIAKDAGLPTGQA